MSSAISLCDLPEKKASRTTSFCSRPIEPETSIMWNTTADESGSGQLFFTR